MNQLKRMLGIVCVLALNVVSVSHAAEPTVLKPAASSSVTYCMAFSPDGSALWSGGDMVGFWDAKTLAPVTNAPKLWGGDFRVTPDRKQAVAIVAGSIMLHDTSTWKNPTRLYDASKQLSDVAISPDAKLIAFSEGLSATTSVWDVQGRKLKFALPGREAQGRSVTGLTFTPDSKSLIVGYWTGDLEVWDMASGRLVSSPVVKSAKAQFAVRFSPDGKHLAVHGPEDTCALLSVPGYKPRLILKGHKLEWRRGVAFSADSRRVATASYDQTLKVWDVATGRLLADFTGMTRLFSAVFWPDGTRIAAGGDNGTVLVWDLPAAAK